MHMLCLNFGKFDKRTILIRMDFGFFSPNDGGNKWLREELVYPGTHIYYAIIFEDVALRLAWVVGLALSKVVKAYLFLVHLINNSTGSIPIIKS